MPPQAKPSAPAPQQTQMTAATQQAQAEQQKRWNEPMQIMPYGEGQPLSITPLEVHGIIATKSKSGLQPGYGDCKKFLQLCVAKRLNPFTGDAYLIGYEEEFKGNTVVNWTLITAIQALRKRAESHPAYRGCMRGVILRVSDGAGGKRLEFRESAFYDDGEVLLGGWAKCFRSDQDLPYFETVKLSAYEGFSRWKKDPGGMITKVAEAAALRRAFPSDLAGMYLDEEFREGKAIERTPTSPKALAAGRPQQLSDLTAHSTPVISSPVGGASAQQVAPSGYGAIPEESTATYTPNEPETEKSADFGGTPDVDLSDGDGDAPSVRTERELLDAIGAAKTPQELEEISSEIEANEGLDGSAKAGLRDMCDERADKLAKRKASNKPAQKTAFDGSPDAGNA